MQVLCNIYSKFIDKFITLCRYHITEWSALTILSNVSGTSSEVQEPVQVHHLAILIFKDLLNQLNFYKTKPNFVQLLQV